MNETGLVVEVMWLDDTRFPGEDERPAISELQWVQYQLDNASTVDEVIASDKTIRISTSSTPLHYLVADAKGNVATIEFLNGRMVIHKGAALPFPVLTNNTYAESSKTAVNIFKDSTASAGNNSLDRFVKACRMIRHLETANITTPLPDYAFSILNTVAQGEFTKWSIVYDITNKKIYFKTQIKPPVKFFSLSAFNFDCTSASRMADMDQAVAGDISTLFTLSNKSVKERVLEQAVRESRSHVTISDEDKAALLNYENGIRCK
jgi:choloylglycine hydrolase